MKSMNVFYDAQKADTCLKRGLLYCSKLDALGENKSALRSGRQSIAKDLEEYRRRREELEMYERILPQHVGSEDYAFLDRTEREKFVWLYRVFELARNGINGRKKTLPAVLELEVPAERLIRCFGSDNDTTWLAARQLSLCSTLRRVLFFEREHRRQLERILREDPLFESYKKVAVATINK